MTDIDYERDIQIDERALDVEWLEQPGRMLRYCRLAADTQLAMNLAKERQDYEVGLAKEHLEMARAVLDKAVRSDPAAYGVVAGSRGITEDAIKAAIQIQPDYQEAVRDQIDAKFRTGEELARARHDYDVAAGAVRAFDQRRAALENLVRLHGQSYFAGPVVPRDLQAERDRLQAERVREAQRSVRVGGSSSPSGPRPRLSMTRGA